MVSARFAVPTKGIAAVKGKKPFAGKRYILKYLCLSLLRLGAGNGPANFSVSGLHLLTLPIRLQLFPDE